MSAVTFAVNEDTLFFAFRYALGRTTAAPSIVTDQLKHHWSRLAQRTRYQIQREISHAIDRGEAGQTCDVATWRQIIALPSGGGDDCPGCGRRAVMCVCSHDDDDAGNSHS